MQAWHRRRFIAAIEYIHSKNRRRRFAGELRASEVFFHRRAYGRDLARLVRRGQYEFAPAEEVEVRIDGKARALYRPQFLDAVVERVLSQWLAETLATRWPPELYSYRPGLSSATAIRAFAAYIRTHRQARPDPRTRGLWVLRRDIKSYGSSIPLDSRLWSPLESCFTDSSEAAIGKSLLRSFLPRRYIRTNESTQPARVETLACGTPTGSFLQPAINNFYLLPADTRLAKESGFYARFGDDILYACYSKEEAEIASSILDETIAELGLKLSTTKCENIYFNGSGHPLGSSNWPSRTRVDFLGASVGFDGHIRLRKDKARRLRRELAARLQAMTTAMGPCSQEERVQHLAVVARAALTPSHPLVLRDAPALWSLVDDRTQLNELDHWLRRRVVELVLRSGIRGFRQLPPRRLYELGLPSLRAQRNRGRWCHEGTSGDDEP